MDKKTRWDKFSILSSFFSGVVLAIIGIVFTIKFSQEQNKIAQKQAELAEQQIQISQMQALETFIPYLNHEKAEMRKFAAERIAGVAGADYATQLATIFKSEEVAKVAEKARATGLGVGQREIPEARIAKTSKRIALKSGWAYLGNYEENQWKTRYFEFDSGTKPENLVKTIQTVRARTGALNVRQGMPDLVGRFPKIIDVLSTGSTVRVVEIKKWYSTGYMWAHIRYD